MTSVIRLWHPLASLLAGIVDGGRGGITQTTEKPMSYVAVNIPMGIILFELFTSLDWNPLGHAQIYLSLLPSQQYLGRQNLMVPWINHP